MATTTTAEQQPPPKQGEPSDEIISAVVAALLVGASISATAATIAAILKPWGITAQTLAAVLGIMRHPGGFPVIPDGGHVAAVQTARFERQMRGWFLFNSSRRIIAQIRAARAMSTTVPTGTDGGVQEAFRRALETERRYWRQHLEAQQLRKAAAQKVGAQVARHGLMLGWYNDPKSDVTPACKEMEGSNFDASRRPLLGYPGTVHHYCRCFAGPAHRTDRLTDKVAAEFIRKYGKKAI